MMLPMKYYFRGILVGAVIALVVFVLAGCGNEDTPREWFDPPVCDAPACAPDYVPVPRPPAHPVPVDPA